MNDVSRSPAPCAARARLGSLLALARPATALGLSLGFAVAAMPARAASVAQPSGTLIEEVRNVTAQYQSVGAALKAGYVQGTPCVSGPDTGAMGVHYVHLDWIEEAMLDVNKPSALIYEPQLDGSMRLVGVEYLVYASVWDAENGSAPSLEGNLLNYIAYPNRYDLPALYEIHVWAWQSNPMGNMADWNTQVTCDNQPTN